MIKSGSVSRAFRVAVIRGMAGLVFLCGMVFNLRSDEPKAILERVSPIIENRDGVIAGEELEVWKDAKVVLIVKQFPPRLTQELLRKTYPDQDPKRLWLRDGLFEMETDLFRFPKFPPSYIFNPTQYSSTIDNVSFEVKVTQEKVVSLQDSHLLACVLSMGFPDLKKTFDINVTTLIHLDQSLLPDKYTAKDVKAEMMIWGPIERPYVASEWEQE